MKNFRLTTLVFLVFISLCAFVVPAEAKDEWTRVQSKNFLLIGNASEKEIRKVATRLEQFRETFRLLFLHTELSSSIPTNVIVFKSDSAYKNFKPRRSDGKIDEFVAGYFQPGEDVNYITLSADGTGTGDDTKYSVIFHEFVHNIVEINFGKSEIPPWFNEGLAEYYETFAIEDDQKIKLGMFQGRHLELLQQNKFLPLAQLFNISNIQLHNTGNHSRSIFYAESWALIHYLIQNGKTDGLNKFLTALTADVPPEKAFKDAFQIDYVQMEAELKKYINRNSFQYNIITLKYKLTFDADMRASVMDEPSSNAYLGDLLYHTQREDEAEPFLQNSLKLAPDSSMANTTLGMVKIKQRKFDDAKRYLEKAISQDPKNHAAYFRYATVLSREGQDEFGYSKSYETATAAKIRELLKKAIAINPSATESYELLAFIDLVTGDELEDAAALMTKALKYQPGNQRYAIRLAEIRARQQKYDEAAAMADKLAKTTDESEIQRRAESLLSEISQRRSIDEYNAAQMKRMEEVKASGGRIISDPRLNNRPAGPKLSPEEVARRNAESVMAAINGGLRKVGMGETRVAGHIQSIDCKKMPVAYTIKTSTESFIVTSKDFDSLAVRVLDPAAQDVAIGCGANLSSLNALVTYRASTGTNRGELVALDFVPENFRVMSEEEIAKASSVIYNEGPEMVLQTNSGGTSDGLPVPKQSSQEDMEAMRRNFMLKQISDALPKPAAGEKREMGYLDKIECKDNRSYLNLHTAAGTFRLLNTDPASLKIILFTPDLNGVQFGCMLKPIEYPVVFVYRDKPNQKDKTVGEVVSLSFVPKSFVLQN